MLLASIVTMCSWNWKLRRPGALLVSWITYVRVARGERFSPTTQCKTQCGREAAQASWSMGDPFKLRPWWMRMDFFYFLKNKNIVLASLLDCTPSVHVGQKLKKKSLDCVRKMAQRYKETAYINMYSLQSTYIHTYNNTHTLHPQCSAPFQPLIQQFPVWV